MKTIINRLNKITAVAICATSLGYATNAFSDVPDRTEWDAPSPWTQVASACSIDESSKGYAFNNADFSFLGSAVSAPKRPSGFTPISVRCNVTNPLDQDIHPGWNTLIVGYQDPDGSQTAASVSARLIQVKRATGAVATLATFNSNSNLATTRGEGYVLFDTVLDFHNNEYFVQLDLIRAAATATSPLVATPLVYSARLVSTTSIPK